MSAITSKTINTSKYVSDVTGCRITGNKILPQIQSGKETHSPYLVKVDELHGKHYFVSGVAIAILLPQKPAAELVAAEKKVPFIFRKITVYKASHCDSSKLSKCAELQSAAELAVFIEKKRIPILRYTLFPFSTSLTSLLKSYAKNPEIKIEQEVVNEYFEAYQFYNPKLTVDQFQLFFSLLMHVNNIFGGITVYLKWCESIDAHGDALKKAGIQIREIIRKLSIDIEFIRQCKRIFMSKYSTLKIVLDCEQKDLFLNIIAHIIMYDGVTKTNATKFLIGLTSEYTVPDTENILMETAYIHKEGLESEGANRELARKIFNRLFHGSTIDTTREYALMETRHMNEKYSYEEVYVPPTDGRQLRNLNNVC